MPQHWGVLERRHGNHHALGRHLYQGMQVLRRQDVTGTPAAGPSRALTYRGGALIGPLHRADLFGGNDCVFFCSHCYFIYPFVVESRR